MERFSREFGLDDIILLTDSRTLPKRAKSALSVDARPAQNVFAQAHYQNVEAFLPGFCSFAE